MTAPAWGCSCRGSPWAMPPSGSSLAALWAPPWLQEESCSAWYPRAAGNSLLQQPLLGCREQLLRAWKTSTLTFGAAGLFLSYFSLLSPSCCCTDFSLPSIHAPRGAPSVAHGSALPSSRSLWELLCHSCSPHYQNLAT